MKPPPLKNDCFAMPPGVDWTPVDLALARLRSRLHTVVGQETLPVGSAAGRVLQADIFARRANPPFANSAVDGYGFAFDDLAGDAIVDLPLQEGRAAAGAPFSRGLTAGYALRVLTGARLPDGVDTVVLEEDCSVTASRISFRSGLKLGANTRAAGEDVQAGAKLFSKGHKLQPQDLALLAACGNAQIACNRRLRVGVLSTGDELVQPGEGAGATQIYDANRVMLGEMISCWGHDVVDLGLAPDDPAAVRAALDHGAGRADVMLTSGGASAGDEDHVSALLAAEGALQTWRIAIKPGRPLALALWKGVPVFGLPGNPVAAFICTLIFARPALMQLAGGGWMDPMGYQLPAAFSKNKKPGRREYLRARRNADGSVGVFPSEGSGRISGLSWSDGLVELSDDAAEITPGDQVTYYPYGAFGL